MTGTLQWIKKRSSRYGSKNNASDDEQQDKSNYNCHLVYSPDFFNQLIGFIHCFKLLFSRLSHIFS